MMVYIIGKSNLIFFVYKTTYYDLTKGIELSQTRVFKSLFICKPIVKDLKYFKTAFRLIKLSKAYTIMLQRYSDTGCW